MITYNRAAMKFAAWFVSCTGGACVPEYPLRLFSGSANRPLAEEIAAMLKKDLGQCKTTDLDDSDIHVQISELVRGDDVFLIQPCAMPVNDNLMELLLYIDAFRRASVHSITLVIPYFPYARQERMAIGREAISARLVARMIETLGASRILWVCLLYTSDPADARSRVDPGGRRIIKKKNMLWLTS